MFRFVKAVNILVLSGFIAATASGCTAVNAHPAGFAKVQKLQLVACLEDERRGRG